MLGSTLSWAESSDTKIIEKYRKIYEDTTKQYVIEFSRATLYLSVEYTKTLQDMLAKFQASGNLSDWEVVNEEIKRFKKNPTLSGVNSFSSEIRSLQDTHRTQVEKLKADKNAKVETLREQYVARLTVLQQDLTKQGKFDDAFAARDESKRVGGVSKKEPDKSKNQSDWINIKSVKNSAPSDVVSLADGTKILPPGVPAPNRDGMHFTEKKLSTTDNSPFSSDVYVKLWESSDKESDRFERDKFVGTVDGKVKSDVRHARVALRKSKSGTALRGLKLQVEYFAKSASGSGDPHLFTRKTVTISDLDTYLIYVDFAPVSIESISRSVDIGYRNHSKTVGEKFYGYIVTVLGADGTILYQSATSGTLAKLAKKPTQENKPDITFDDISTRRGRQNKIRRNKR